MTGNLEQKNGTSYKIVGLIGSVVAILAIFVGAITWVSMNMANNTGSIISLKEDYLRHEVAINENTQIIHQHAQLLAILDQHDKSINILTNFMTQGGRFTAADGRRIHDEVQIVKAQIQHYEVLETELSWIKKSIRDLEINVRSSFSDLNKNVETIATKQDRVYEGHMGQFHEDEDRQ